MKRLLLIVLPLLLIVGCSKKEPLNYGLLEERDGVHYQKGTNEIYSGPIFNIDGKSGGYLKNGKFEGPFKTYYDNGQKKLDGKYKDGKKDGLWYEWYENGQKYSEGNFKDGKVDGLATEWYENGQKSWEGTYKDGELISEKCWDKNGNEERCLEEFLKEFEKEKKVLEAKEVIEKKVEKKVEKKIMELREEPN